MQAGTPLGDVRDLAELQAQFPGVTTILETWFTNYKGPGAIECRGFLDVAHAEQVLATAEAAGAARR